MFRHLGHGCLISQAARTVAALTTYVYAACNLGSVHSADVSRACPSKSVVRAVARLMQKVTLTEDTSCCLLVKLHLPQRCHQL